MKRHFLTLTAGASVFGAIYAAACSTPDNNVTNIDYTLDASIDANEDVAASTAVDGNIPPAPDAAMSACALNDGSDPVGLCVQKTLLSTMHQSAYSATAGVAASVDSTTFVPDKNDAGAEIHDVRVDAAYAAACALYHTNSQLYGDSELTPTTDDDLAAIAALIITELATLPASYDGTFYAHLRSASSGLRYINENTLAASIDALADAYGSAIYTTYFQSLGPAGDGGASDGVLGTNANGTVTYSPDEVATGALALLDMANRAAANDAGADAGAAVAWQEAAITSLDHIRNRAREGTSNLYYRTMTTTAGATRDTPAGAAPTDFLSSDVQADIALALSRAQDLVNDNATALAAAANYPFAAHASEILNFLNGTNGYDASTGSPSFWDPTGNGYYAGYTPSTQTMLTDKPVHANAFLLALIHRADFLDPTLFPAQITPLRALFLTTTPANSSFFSVTPTQLAYFEATSKTFGFVTDGSTVAPPKSYASLAITSAIEGLTEELYRPLP